jgi:hypothetical protein
MTISLHAADAGWQPPGGYVVIPEAMRTDKKTCLDSEHDERTWPEMEVWTKLTDHHEGF